MVPCQHVYLKNQSPGFKKTRKKEREKRKKKEEKRKEKKYQARYNGPLLA